MSVTIVPDKTGEIKVELTHEKKAQAFPLKIENSDHYSVWSSSKGGTVRVFAKNDLHYPVAMAQQELNVKLEPGEYLVSLTGEIGNFTLNVKTAKSDYETAAPTTTTPPTGLDMPPVEAKPLSPSAPHTEPKTNA